LFDATSGGSAVTSDDSSVQRWEDKSGNGFHLIQSLGTAAKYRTAVQNGLPVVRFLGGTRLDTAAQFPIIGNADFSMFFVFKPTSPYAAAWGWGTFNGGFVGVYLENNLQIWARPSANVVIRGSLPAQWYVVSVVKSGNSYSFASTSAGTFSASNAQTTASSVLSVGSVKALDESQGNFAYGGLNGDLGELAIFDRALSSTEVSEIRASLAAKWNVS
jgi:hypothetical protein